MTTIVLDKVEVTSVAVQIPDNCPACNVDFTVEGNLSVHGYTSAIFDTHLTGDETDPLADDGDESGGVELFDMDYTTRLECRACGQRFLPTEAR